MELSRRGAVLDVEGVGRALGVYVVVMGTRSRNKATPDIASNVV